MAEDPVDAHLARFQDPQRSALERTRARIAAALPGAEQVIAYGMPTFKVEGVAVVGFEGFARHNSLFPYSSTVVGLVREELPDWVTSKGTIQFPLDTPFPAGLLTRVLRLRIEEINASFPKRSGEHKEFFDNGRLKLTGRMAGGARQGKWRWYRRDGSLMRTGTFLDGVPTGRWSSYDREGTVVAATNR